MLMLSKFLVKENCINYIVGEKYFCKHKRIDIGTQPPDYYTHLMQFVNSSEGTEYWDLPNINIAHT